mmetsp:Transcript_68840/g.128481  ORF Transcript_68840/g.128481 Transcript_68840/m.128481 type:complete len:207 (-) Transcript_68840:502-1122(-)
MFSDIREDVLFFRLELPHTAARGMQRTTQKHAEPQQRANQAHQGQPHGISVVVLVLRNIASTLSTEQVDPCAARTPHTKSRNSFLLRAALISSLVIPSGTNASPFTSVAASLRSLPLLGAADSTNTQLDVVFNIAAMSAAMVCVKPLLDASMPDKKRSKSKAFPAHFRVVVVVLAILVVVTTAATCFVLVVVVVVVDVVGTGCVVT